MPADRHVHSLHAYFVRPGDPSIPIVYETERVRDGRSFTTRRVLAIQRGEPIFALSASFQLAQEGLVHAEPMPTGLPTPDDVEDLGARAARGDGGWMAGLPRPLDIRMIDEPVWSRERSGPTDEPTRLWLRADGRLPDDPLLHLCVLTYASDLTLLGSVVARHDVPRTGLQMASLDHAMWFHGPFRADEWMLYSCFSPAASGGRGLASGRFFTADGRHVVTTMQEGLVRVPAGTTGTPGTRGTTGGSR